MAAIIKYSAPAKMRKSKIIFFSTFSVSGARQRSYEYLFYQIPGISHPSGAWFYVCRDFVSSYPVFSCAIIVLAAAALELLSRRQHLFNKNL